MAKLPPLAADKAIEQLRWLLEHGTTVKTDHFKDELRAAGATMVDVENLIRGACTLVSVEWDSDHRNYKYRFSGQDLEDETLEIVVVLNVRNSKLICITAI